MSDYDPVKCLQEEVDRFKATNQFTPMLVTGFYIQAAVVLDEHKNQKERIAELKRELAERQRTCDGSCDIALARRQVGPDGYVPGNARECAEMWEREASRLNGERQTFHGPCRFYFVTPRDLVKPEEVPAWAGMIHCWPYLHSDEKQHIAFRLNLRIVRQAPVLHRCKIDPAVHQQALESCYWRYHNLFR